MNVFDLRGPEFLQFYLVVLLGAVCIGALLRWWLRTPGDALISRLPALDAYQVAYLSGGLHGAVRAAIASLVHRGLVKVDGSVLRVKRPLIQPIHSFEQKVYDTVVAGGASPEGIRRQIPPAARNLAAPLEQHQLVFPKGWLGPARIVPALLMVVVLAIGLIKVQVGIERNRPVTLLFLLCIVTVVVALIFLLPVHRSRRGDQLLKQLESRNEALKSTVNSKSAVLAPDDLAMAVGLFGLGAIMDPNLAEVHRLLHPRNTNDGGSWISSCGSGCGSSGCGGGGCGGCGG